MAIPKIIHYCWFGYGEKPKLAVKCIESWKKYCPDFEIKEWNETNIDIKKMPLYVKQAYENKMWAFVTDYIRLWIIYNFGGIYFDTDVEIIKSLEDLLINKAFCGFEDKKNNWISLGLGFGAEKGNEFLFEHMNIYKNINFINSDGSLNKTSIPKYTTELFIKKGLQQKNKNIQCIENFCIYPNDYFAPKNYYTEKINITKNTYSIHHYSMSWCDETNFQKFLRTHPVLMGFIIMPKKILKKIFGNKYEIIKKVIKN